jgi:Tol biopolymer transport system component
MTWKIKKRHLSLRKPHDEAHLPSRIDGKKILSGSNREPNQDEFFNYDLFTLNVADGSIQRLTATEYNEYDAIWSPDGKQIVYRGTRRGITDRETTMEDTRVWAMNADGSNRREIGAAVDNRQGAPRWSADSGALYFTVQERGNNVLMRLPVSGGTAQYVISAKRGSLPDETMVSSGGGDDAPGVATIWPSGNKAALDVYQLPQLPNVHPPFAEFHTRSLSMFLTG